MTHLTQDRQSAASQMLEDGASYREVSRTLHMHERTLRKYFPGCGWTFKQAGEMSAVIRHNPLSKEF